MLKNTDLDMCKEIAVLFLKLQIKPSDMYGLGIVDHPFFNSAFVYDKTTMTMVNIVEDKAAHKRVVSDMKEVIQKTNDITFLMMLINQPYKLTFLKYISDYLNIKDLSTLLIEAWTTEEFPNRNINVSKSELIGLFQKASIYSMMDKEELSVYNLLGDTITVYRGINNLEPTTEDIYALSWTLNIKTAKWFANRFEQEGVVYEAKINKDDILTYSNRRNEKEVILDYSKLYDVREIYRG